MQQPKIHQQKKFDPSYGFNLNALLEVTAPPTPPGYKTFWQQKYQTVLSLDPLPQLHDTGQVHNGWRIFDFSYQSTNNVNIAGWLTVPSHGQIRRGIVISHGYGGRSSPDVHLPFEEAVLCFPCSRGLSLSPHPPIPNQAHWHVLHNINQWDQYVHGGCVEDIWLAFSAILQIFPQTKDHLGFLGTSFGGGIGAMALAWDQRIQRGHLNVPSFGHHPMRLELPTHGSAASVQAFNRKHPEIAQKTLSYYDAAIAAQYIKIPMLNACALQDPCVAPPGQFAIHNEIPSKKELFVLHGGHCDYPKKAVQEEQLHHKLNTFFEPL